MMNSVGRNVNSKNGSNNNKIGKNKTNMKKTRKSSIAELSGNGFQKKKKDVSREMNNSR